MKSIPSEDTQVGINGLLSTSKFWVQGGYNSFYGVSGGLGATFAQQFSIGGLLEFGTDSSLNDEKSTIEIVASYHFGQSDNRRKVVGFDVERDDALAKVRLEAEEERKKREEEREKEEKEKQMLADQQLTSREEQVRDSIAQADLAALRLKEQQRLDSISQVVEENVEIQANEKYEEVASGEGLEPGFYLIANVFGTKKYYENFMVLLKKRGLSPKSFYREVNKYRYVYLERYNTMNEARKARDSKFDGQYPHKTWIFRVRAN